MTPAADTAAAGQASASRPRIVAIIDGEHYPPVVRFALERLAERATVVGLVFAGGSEKVDAIDDLTAYGHAVIRGETAGAALAAALEALAPDEVVDLSDEPVLSAWDRMRLASVALERGAAYVGADFRFEPPQASVWPVTPVLGVIGTGKRVGKTALSADIARRLKARGLDLVVLAMGRGGPEEPELIRGDEVALTTEDLLALAAQGRHASSDNYEDAVMSRVTTVGTRRCGGGLAGETFFGNVAEGARLADSLGKELLIVEGSGAAIPPVAMDAAVLVVGAAQGAAYVTDFFGPYRLARADAVVVAGAEEPFADASQVAEVAAAVERLRPGLPVACVTFRPRPLEPVAGKRVFFATTAPARMLPALVSHLEKEQGCEVVGASPYLSDRARLRADMAASAGYDVLLTELKAAAIDVVAASGAGVGVPTVLCDNVPVGVSGDDFEPLIGHLGGLALTRGTARAGNEV